MPSRSPILTEVAYLTYFFAIFVAMVYAFNLWVVPHHFNDKVAIVISAVGAAGVMIATRAYLSARTRRR